MYTVLKQSIEASKKIRLRAAQSDGNRGSHLQRMPNNFKFVCGSKKLPSPLGVTYPMHMCTCAGKNPMPEHTHVSIAISKLIQQTECQIERLSLSVSVRGFQWDGSSTFSTCSSPSSQTCSPSPFHYMTFWFVC